MRHKWEWAKGHRAGVKQCTICKLVKFPAPPFGKASFFMGLKEIAVGKTPPCKPTATTKEHNQ